MGDVDISAEAVDALVMRKRFIAGDNGSAILSWDDLCKIDDRIAVLRERITELESLNATRNQQNAAVEVDAFARRFADMQVDLPPDMRKVLHENIRSLYRKSPDAGSESAALAPQSQQPEREG